MHAGIGIVNDPYEPPLFRDECFIAFVISHLRTEFALPDDLVVQEGTLATAMYFLIQGRCQVIGNYNKKNEEVFNTLAEGDHFGEIGVLMQVGGLFDAWPPLACCPFFLLHATDPRPFLYLPRVLSLPCTSYVCLHVSVAYQVKRTATVKAATFCHVYLLTAMKLKLIAVRYPHVAYRIKQVVKRTMAKVNKKEIKMTPEHMKNLSTAVNWSNADGAKGGEAQAQGDLKGSWGTSGGADVSGGAAARSASPPASMVGDGTAEARQAERMGPPSPKTEMPHQIWGSEATTSPGAAPRRWLGPL